MDNKYTMVEEQDFKHDASNNSIYIGNNEGIEYFDITDYVEKKKINSSNYMFAFRDYNKSNDNLKGVKLSFNSINNMDFAFIETKLESLDLSEFNVENVTSFFKTFRYFESQSLNLSNFNTKKSLVFDGMFEYAKIKKLDISSFYFSYSATIDYIFEEFKCEELILPESFPHFGYLSDVFNNSEIKVIKTPNKKFYEEHKKWFKEEHNTELILIL